VPGLWASAAAHLLSRKVEPLVLEAGTTVAHSIRQWGHVGMFAPWRFCVDREAAKLLTAQGWQHPPLDDVPTGADLVARGSGAGRVAMTALVKAAAAAGFWKLLSRIFPENTASRALMAKRGFREVGTYQRHAKLDGAWRDCVIVERLLGGAAE
jgi:hypothetical protein